MVVSVTAVRAAPARSGAATFASPLRARALRHLASPAVRAHSTSSNSKVTTARLTAQQNASRRAGRNGIRYTTAAAAVTAVALTTWYATTSPVYSEAAPSVATTGDITPTTMSQQDQMRQRAKLQGVYAWGSNRYNVVAPDAPSVTLIRSPRSIPFFDGVALRDINLQEKHGVAVDANGDVYQWGLGFFDPSVREMTAIEDVPLGRRREKTGANLNAPLGNTASLVLNPVKTLTGKNIIKVEATEEKIYALSKDGHVYVFSAVQQLQSKPKYPGWSPNPLKLFNAFASPTIDHEVLHPAPSAHWGSTEKVQDIIAGSHHLLTVSNKGRTFATPISEEGNAFGQLGTRRVWLNAPKTPDSKAGHVETLLEPRVFAELEENHGGRPISTLVPSSWLPAPSTETYRTSKPKASSEPVFQTSTDPAPPPKPLTEPTGSIRWCTTLHEIPALRKLNIVQIAAGNEHSLARTHDGRVLAWGRHTHGQCGLGSNFSVECVPVPTEVVLSRSFSNNSLDVRATSIAAGADNSFFMTTRRESSGAGNGLKIDLLASGKGQWGTIGNAMWSQVVSQPSRVKTVSGLMEFSEATGKTHPVPIHSISIGKPGHVALVLDTVESAGHLAFGRDVMVWGANAGFQLGLSKRSNLAVPQHLKPLPALTSIAGGNVISEQDGLVVNPAKAAAVAAATLPTVDPKLREADLHSGALTHMPHNRLQLASRTKSDTHLPPAISAKDQLAPVPGASAVQIQQGKTKKNLTVEESIKAGTVSTVVYWKIVE
ncbi:related to FMP25 - mitochondrial inner membrane protein involved in assembly of cytochrome bc1 complex [Ustilago trichophora]|uniref:Related to FMP25 - mitochondrial inner membrane protein involved in assembly of cytochrome bc1 complex n=1 Tax=Ustilago trichophora TaxID=86804 RepID=A0A5C3DUJ9_9BASI|nr:related to FMP25 - mitochondrial inner membrane protein involved in assembly of cytochrome bc1 complex [Ustilago trichophora]